MTLEEEWLSQILGENTKTLYIRGLHLFMQFLGVSKVEELKGLEKRRAETLTIQFYQFLQQGEKPISANSARAMCIPVQSVFKYIGTPLQLKNKLPPIGTKVEKWRPSIENLQKIYRSNDLPVKAWMSLSRDVPARISDLMTVTPEQIQSNEFDLKSKKEGVLGRVYISPQTQELFQQLSKSGLSLPTTSRGISDMMEKACRTAELPMLNQHLWRKIFASKCMDLGINESAWHFLLFKSVAKSDSTYLMNASSLREQWQKVVDALPLEPKNGNGIKTVELENALKAVESENAISKTRIDMLQKTLEEQAKKIEQLGENWDSLFKGAKKIVQRQQKEIEQLKQEGDKA